MKLTSYNKNAAKEISLAAFFIHDVRPICKPRSRDTAVSARFAFFRLPPQLCCSSLLTKRAVWSLYINKSSARQKSHRRFYYQLCLLFSLWFSNTLSLWFLLCYRLFSRRSLLGSLLLLCSELCLQLLNLGLELDNLNLLVVNHLLQ